MSIAIVEAAPAKAHQGRWGWHPCDYPTFLKLKAIAREYRRAVCLAAAFARWERKEERNRVSRPKIRDEQGRPIGYGDPAPVERPVMDSPLGFVVVSREQFDRSGQYVKEGVQRTRFLIRPEAREALSDYTRARRPAADPSELQPLATPAAAIDRLLASLKTGA